MYLKNSTPSIQAIVYYDRKKKHSQTLHYKKRITFEIALALPKKNLGYCTVSISSTHRVYYSDFPISFNRKIGKSRRGWHNKLLTCPTVVLEKRQNTIESFQNLNTIMCIMIFLLEKFNLGVSINFESVV